MCFWEELANALGLQFEQKHGRKSWGHIAVSARSKFVDECIRMVGIFERMKNDEWKCVHGLERVLALIRSGEDMVLVETVQANDVELISEELKTNTSVLALFISGCQVGDEGARHLSEMMRRNSTILSLYIFANRIGVEGARYIVDMLRENSTLMYLDIGSNLFGAQGTRYISDILREKSTLLYLDISGNQIGAEGTRHLSEMLRKNSTLLYLDIRYNSIGDEGARHLSDMLRENSTLLYLHIWMNEIGSEGARHLSAGLRENSTLLYLDMQNNEIGPHGTHHLSNMMRENSTLLYLGIARNQIGSEGALHLLDGLRDNSSMLKLNIWQSNIDDRELEARIQNDIESRMSPLNPLTISFDECRVFLQSTLSIESWVSVLLVDFPYSIHDQFPPELWGEILSFLSNDSTALQESILVPDLRCGFLSPSPICSFTSKETPLLSIIPLIEGLFRVDGWTLERLYRLRFQGLH